MRLGRRRTAATGPAEPGFSSVAMGGGPGRNKREKILHSRPPIVGARQTSRGSPTQPGQVHEATARTKLANEAV